MVVVLGAESGDFNFRDRGAAVVVAFTSSSFTGAFTTQGALTPTTVPFGKTSTISPFGPTAVIGSFSVVEVVVVGGRVVVVGQTLS